MTTLPGYEASKNLVLSTFICGSITLPCLACHPSCSDCTTTTGFCDSCKAGSDAQPIAENSACKCIDGKGSNNSQFGLNYHEGCNTCHGACETCYNDRSDTCYTCKVSHAVRQLGSKDIGRCICGNGYQPYSNPTQESHCQSCVPAGCPVCVGYSEADCFGNLEAYYFTQNTGPFGASVTSNTHICYRIPLALPTCAFNVLEDIMGTLPNDGNGLYQPEGNQCYLLLESMWPYLNYWFGRIFHSFDPPLRYLPKSYAIANVKLWILQFTPVTLLRDQDWTPIVTALNQPAANYDNYMAWAGPTPGYTLDGGATIHDLPEALETWVQTNCSFDSCPDLWVFLIGTRVCDTSGCLLQEKCAAILSTSVCALG